MEYIQVSREYLMFCKNCGKQYLKVRVKCT